jgi:hypothetical protein
MATSKLVNGKKELVREEGSGEGEQSDESAGTGKEKGREMEGGKKFVQRMGPS